MSRRYVNQLGHQEAVDQVFRRLREAAAPQPQRESLSADGAFRPHGQDRRADVERLEAVYKAFDNGDYVRVEGTTQLFQGAVQLIATRLTKVDAQRGRSPTISPRCGPWTSTSCVLRLGEILRGMTDRACKPWPSASCWTRRSWPSSPGAGGHQEPPRLPGRPAGARRQPHGGRAPDQPLLSADRPQPAADGRLPARPGQGRRAPLRPRAGLLRRRPAHRPPGHGRQHAGSQGRRGGKALRRAAPGRDRAAAEAHDRQPSRRVRLRQPQAAHDAGGRGPVLPRQPGRQGEFVPAAAPRRPERRQPLDRTSIPTWTGSCSRGRAEQGVRGIKA